MISEGNRDTILQLPWIDKHLDLIRELAYAKVPVDLFDESESKATWGDIDFKPLRLALLVCICLRSNHNQRLENYVQLAKLTARTNVGHL